MTYHAIILGLLLFTAWLVGRNLRHYRRAVAAAEDGPLVSVLVPARNEAANIEACLEGLLAQRYRRLEVLVLDDGSTDDTAERVRKMAARDDRLCLVHGTGLPRGWAGKAHACWEVSRCARGEWLLFVDADTRHEPELVGRAVRAAQATGCDFLSTFPRQETRSLGEALTAPFIYWVLFTLLPFHKVWSSPKPSFTAACGQFLFVRRAVYEETGGHSAIRASLHDGLHLARLLKRKGKKIRLVDLSDQIRCRMYSGFRQSWDGFSRNAYQGIGSFPLLVFLTLWHGLLGLGPFISLAIGLLSGAAWTGLAAAQVILLFGIQLALRSRFRYSWATVALHPLGIAVLIGIQWASWWKSVSRAGTVWKGRSVPGSEPSQASPSRRAPAP